MKIIALKSFCGVVCSMGKNEVRDIPEGAVLDDLLNAGLVAPYTEEEPAEENTKKKAAKEKAMSDENKRVNRRKR